MDRSVVRTTRVGFAGRRRKGDDSARAARRARPERNEGDTQKVKAGNEQSFKLHCRLSVSCDGIGTH